jgi:hypothetical protein
LCFDCRDTLTTTAAWDLPDEPTITTDCEFIRDALTHNLTLQQLHVTSSFPSIDDDEEEAVAQQLEANRFWKRRQAVMQKGTLGKKEVPMGLFPHICGLFSDKPSFLFEFLRNDYQSMNVIRDVPLLSKVSQSTTLGFEDGTVTWDVPPMGERLIESPECLSLYDSFKIDLPSPCTNKKVGSDLPTKPGIHWQQWRDNLDGRFYYENLEDGTVTWDAPSGEEYFECPADYYSSSSENTKDGPQGFVPASSPNLFSSSFGNDDPPEYRPLSLKRSYSSLSSDSSDDDLPTYSSSSSSSSASKSSYAEQPRSTKKLRTYWG